jgi:hypothetical protein
LRARIQASRNEINCRDLGSLQNCNPRVMPDSLVPLDNAPYNAASFSE